MDRIQKFLMSLSKKDRKLFLRIFADVRILKLAEYDVKKLKGASNAFRLRKGKIRVVFVKSKGMGLLINVGFRKDAYR